MAACFTTPQITWHGGEQGKNAPVMSLDFHPEDPELLVTVGTDGEVRVGAERKNSLQALSLSLSVS